MIEWPIYRNFSVFSQNSGYFDQNEKGVKKCPFPQSLRFCHNWWASGGVPGVRYAEKLSALFYLHWESLWPGVDPVAGGHPRLGAGRPRRRPPPGGGVVGDFIRLFVPQPILLASTMIVR